MDTNSPIYCIQDIEQKFPLLAFESDPFTGCDCSNHFEKAFVEELLHLEKKRFIKPQDTTKEKTHENQ